MPFIKIIKCFKSKIYTFGSNILSFLLKFSLITSEILSDIFDIFKQEIILIPFNIFLNNLIYFNLNIIISIQSNPYRLSMVVKSD